MVGGWWLIDVRWSLFDDCVEGGEIKRACEQALIFSTLNP
jgi:hypothetical protein